MGKHEVKLHFKSEKSTFADMAKSHEFETTTNKIVQALNADIKTCNVKTYQAFPLRRCT